MSTGTDMTRPAVALPPGPGGRPGLVLELDGVTKVYPGSPPVTALAGVSFAVDAGELVAIAGPSGSGKSTLLHLMGTLDRPSSGIVRVEASIFSSTSSIHEALPWATTTFIFG